MELNTRIIMGNTSIELNKGLILTDELEGEEEADGFAIKYMPLWKWILGD